MEASQQQQQYEYQSQYQIPPPTTNSTILTNDPSSQLQSYDPSYYNAYYTLQQPQPQPQQQQQQDYTTPSSSSSYYYPDYSLIHPPGVDPNTQTSYLHSSQQVYYPPPVVPSHTPSGYFMPAPAPRGRSSHAGGIVRGRGGRGRGRGRGKHGPATTDVAASQPMASSSNATPSKPSQMAWCEICRVDCNTAEILEQHKNGKKHKRNLKVYEELQNLSKGSLVQPRPENVPFENPQGLQPAAEVENKAETAQQMDVANKIEPSFMALPAQVSTTNDYFSGRGGLKRKMRGGRGGKWMRTYDGSRRFIPPPMPKQVVPLFCELCNVKCESQVVFDSHVTGKKHLSNVKRFEEHKKAFGEGVKELYPTIPNLPSASIVPQINQQSAQDAQALASMMLSQQNLQDPQAAQAALVQLLNQHGIYDAQTLVTQLIPYLLAQFQAPGAVQVPVAGVGTDMLNSQLQGTQFPVGAENQNSGSEIKTEQPNNAANAESHQAGKEANDKPDDGQPSDNPVIKPSEDGNGGAEPIIPAPTEEEDVEEDKQK